MQPERWQQIDQLFHLALERDPSERAAFLAEACDGDASLRDEVESLLESHEQSNDFIEAPAADIAAELFVEREDRLTAGQSVGPYQVVSLLGEGGMGEVYLAQDLRLGRRVALKRLRAQFTLEAERVRRFEQEARAASALNHPNIVTIYEIGQLDSLHFIVTEFIDGETLRCYLADAEHTLAEILDIAAQVASALAAAHATGIIHRDIKPENIMVRRDHIVKVLDFGLAKLAPDVATVETRAAARSAVRTDPGTVMGTVQYMSPEQARGNKVDSRTDLWSLGVVLYEMVTGRTPFEGETPSHVIVALLENEPSPLKSYLEVPSELEQIVRRALRKNKEERYQTASDLAFDLNSLKQKIQVEARLKGPAQPVASTRELPLEAAQKKPERSRKLTTPTGPVAAHTTASVEYLIRLFKLQPERLLLFVALLFAVTGAAIGLYKWLNPRVRRQNFTLSGMRFTKLTTTGDVSWAYISPDGKYLLIPQQPEVGGPVSLWIRQMATGNMIQIMPPTTTLHYGGVTFSPDSSFVYLWTFETDDWTGGYLLRVPIIPGPPQRILERVDSGVTFSPDGKQMAFVRFGAGGERAVIIINTDGSHERVLATRNDREARLTHVYWSPDGKIIAARSTRSDTAGNYDVLEGLAVNDGAPTRLTKEHWALIRLVAWRPESNSLILDGVDRPGGIEKLWLLSLPEGTAQPLTNELSTYGSLSSTVDGTRLVTTQTDRPANIWLVPNGDGDRARKLNNVPGRYGTASWTPDGHIVYDVENGTGEQDIWIMAADGSQQKQLTFNSGENYMPAVSTDGRYIFFVSNRSGAWQIWRMNIDGADQIQLTASGVNFEPLCSPDGSWVFYKSREPNKTTIWKIGLDGRRATKVIDRDTGGSLLMALSTDRRLAYEYYDDQTKKFLICIQPLAGGSPEQVLELSDAYNQMSWSPDGRGLIYTKHEERHRAANLWYQPLNGGAAKRLTSFKSDYILRFDWPRDGKSLLMVRASWTSDVVLISAN